MYFNGALRSADLSQLFAVHRFGQQNSHLCFWELSSVLRRSHVQNTVFSAQQRAAYFSCVVVPPLHLLCLVSKGVNSRLNTSSFVFRSVAPFSRSSEFSSTIIFFPPLDGVPRVCLIFFFCIAEAFMLSCQTLLRVKRGEEEFRQMGCPRPWHPHIVTLQLLNKHFKLTLQLPAHCWYASHDLF